MKESEAVTEPFFPAFRTRGLYFHVALDLTNYTVGAVQESRQAFLRK